jgi:DNA-binding transcriptional regulator YhcF (GntR family)
MRLWLNRTAEVSLREQLITQVTLGILSKELKAGERLPSTRELARRFGIHANTASAAYRDLERDGWLEFRHGSGVYVQASRPGVALSPETAVDQLIGELAAKVRKLGAPQAMLRERVLRWLAAAPPARWLVIEPDDELRRIVMHEMGQALSLPIEGCSPGDCNTPGVIDGGIAVVLPSKATAVRKILPSGTELTILEVHPVAPELLAHLQRYLPDRAGELVGIASRWQEFQRIARTMLIAAGLPPECLLIRDANRAGWKRGLDATAGVVCDAVTALELPKGVHALRFSLLNEPTLARLRSHERQVAGTSSP